MVLEPSLPGQLSPLRGVRRGVRAPRVWFLPPTPGAAPTLALQGCPPQPPTPALFCLLPLLFPSLFFKQPLDFLAVCRTCPTVAGTFRVCLLLVCWSHTRSKCPPLAGAIMVLSQRFSVPLLEGNGGSSALLHA